MSVEKSITVMSAMTATMRLISFKFSTAWPFLPIAMRPPARPNVSPEFVPYGKAYRRSTYSRNAWAFFGLPLATDHDSGRSMKIPS